MDYERIHATFDMCRTEGTDFSVGQWFSMPLLLVFAKNLEGITACRFAVGKSLGEPP
jgi:hypothetical protein